MILLSKNFGEKIPVKLTEISGSFKPVEKVEITDATRHIVNCQNLLAISLNVAMVEAPSFPEFM